MKMREPMRLRKPMMRVPVFREMQAQQFASFGRETILGRKISSLKRICTACHKCLDISIY